MWQIILSIAIGFRYLHRTSIKRRFTTEPDFNRTGYIPEIVQEFSKFDLVVNSSYKTLFCIWKKSFFEIHLEQLKSCLKEYSFEKVAFAGFWARFLNIAALLYSLAENAYALVTDDSCQNWIISMFLIAIEINPLFRVLLERFNSARVKNMPI